MKFHINENDNVAHGGILFIIIIKGTDVHYLYLLTEIDR
jgi:hypothetical protein